MYTCSKLVESGVCMIFSRIYCTVIHGAVVRVSGSIPERINIMIFYIYSVIMFSHVCVSEIW